MQQLAAHLLEDQFHLIPARVAGIKSQATKHEITIRFLEPFGFGNIAADANAWKKFMNEQVGPSQLDYLLIMYILYLYFLSPYAKGQNFVKERLGEAQKEKREVQEFLFFV